MLNSPVNKYAENLAEVRQNIERYSPFPEKVRLVAVTKEHTPDDVRLLYEIGLREFGENRVQELNRKQESLSDLKDISWHFIGHLQTNKVKNIAGKTALIHSVDRLHLADKLNLEAEKKGVESAYLIQVNIAREEQKSGIFPEETGGFLRIVKRYPRIVLRGLMTMAPFTDDMTLCGKVFSQAHALFAQLQQEVSPLHSFNILSMGMSNDYIPALKAGSSMLRIGSLLFK